MKSREDLPLVLIAGCPRSGTTWVSRMFLRDKRVAFTYETALASIFLRPWWEVMKLPLPHPEPEPTWRDRAFDLLEALLVRRRQTWFPAWRDELIHYFDDRLTFILRHSGLSKRGNGWSRVREQLLDYDDLLRMIDASERIGFIDRETQAAHLVEQVYGRFFASDPEAEVLVDKTPGELFHAEFLLGTFPQARLIEIVRDGRDVCVSMDAYTDFMPQKRILQALIWRAFIQKGLELRQNPLYESRILRVRYEDLKRDSVGEIERMFDFAGLPIDLKQIRALAEASDIKKQKDVGEGKHVRKGVVGDWRERLGEDDLKLFRDKAGDAFLAAGYSW